MGRAEPGMEDDGPIADSRDMPSFLSALGEGKAKFSPMGAPPSDGKESRRAVARSNSRLSLDGGGVDSEGNNNNNCNGGGGRVGRRASAVEILRRSFGSSRSPSDRRLSNKRRMQRGDEHVAADADLHMAVCDDCLKSDTETGAAGTTNEPTLNESTTSDPQGVEFLTVAEKCHHIREDRDNISALGESFSAKEHVFCTVYCTANERHQGADITHRRNGSLACGEPEEGFETAYVVDLGNEPSLYSLEDLVDPFRDISSRSYKEEAGAGSALESCRVCLEDKTIASLPCCRKAVCDECIDLYVSSQVKVGKVLISCPIPECTGTLEEGLVVSHLSSEGLAKYHYFLELSQLDSSTKPCPQCSFFTSLKEHNPNRSEHKYKIQCTNCQFVWCFKCHAPWHDGLKCRDYRKGDKLLRTWASVIEHGQRNAQKCPECKIHIQRTEGCDHMTCAQCNTNFCYRCGERYRHLRFFGDHTSNLSVFGCKYRYLPEKPHLRRFIRGSVCATKVLVAPLVILLVIVLGAVAMVIGLFVFPVFYMCRKKKKQQHPRGSGRWI